MRRQEDQHSGPGSSTGACGLATGRGWFGHCRANSWLLPHPRPQPHRLGSRAAWGPPLFPSGLRWQKLSSVACPRAGWHLCSLTLPILLKIILFLKIPFRETLWGRLSDSCWDLGWYGHSRSEFIKGQSRTLNPSRVDPDLVLQLQTRREEKIPLLKHEAGPSDSVSHLYLPGFVPRSDGFTPGCLREYLPLALFLLGNAACLRFISSSPLRRQELGYLHSQLTLLTGCRFKFPLSTRTNFLLGV